MDLAATSTRQDFQSLFSLYMTIALVVAVLVVATIAYAVIRHRRRDGIAPRETPGLKPLEAVWVGVVAATVAVLLVATFRTEGRVDAVPADAPQTVRVVAFQWGWRFSYPGTGVATTGNDVRPPSLVVPADESVRFAISSRDVIHSFWIPDLRFKRDAFPNRVTDFDLVFDPGVTTVGRCAEFCGLGHDRMDFQVVSMQPSDFQRWLNARELAIRRSGRGGAG
jgi:cytochrome c oxidase subunit II